MRVISLLSISALLSCNLSFASNPSGDDVDSPIRAAAQSTTLEPEVTDIPMNPPGLATEPDGEGRVMGFLRKHGYHFLTVFLVEQADHLYEERAGPHSSLRFFGSPLGIDRAVLRRYSEPSGNRFIAQNKTAVMQGVSLGAMLWVNGSASS